MLSSASAPGGPSFLLIEFGLTLTTVVLAACWPKARISWILPVERTVSKLASYRLTVCIAVGLAAIALRLLVIPFSPIPHPYIHDDFSFLLAADTFASGRLTNLPHPMWVHFESFHITVKPTYMSMYFPAQGMLLALGKVVAGHEWYGVLLSCGFMCAAICWMLQGWLPPRWALLGGFLAILRLALYSYWVDSYCGGALIAGAGALVLGAVPRIRHALTTKHCFLMAIGIAVLAISRPYEGLLVCLPSVAAVCWGLWKTQSNSRSAILARVTPAVVLLVATFAFMGYYNYRVFGSAFTLPYAVNRATYASAPHFLWQSPRPEPAYRHKEMRDFYSGWELKGFLRAHSAAGFVELSTAKVAMFDMFYLGSVLLIPLVALPKVLRDKRLRFLVVVAVVFAAGLLVETWFIPHYFAPFTAGLYALLLQGLRHLHAWRRTAASIGRLLVYAVPVVSVMLAALRISAGPLNIPLHGWPSETLYGSEAVGLARAAILSQLEQHSGKQLAIVRYSPDHPLFEDWVYNAADIDSSKVVWARDMQNQNQELLAYFKDRRTWLVEPDANPPKISPYLSNPRVGEASRPTTRVCLPSSASLTKKKQQE